MDCKIVRTVDFLIVSLWMDGLFVAAARLPEGRDHTLGPRVERRLHVRLLLFFLKILHALLLFFHLLLHLLCSLYLCAQANPILIPCPLFCVTKTLCGCLPAALMRNGAFI